MILMAVLSMLHGRLSSAIILFALVCAVWGAWACLRKQAVSGSYWGVLLAGELLVIVQGLAGLAMLVEAQPPDKVVHVLYGVLAALTWPVACSYARGLGRETLICSLASFLVVAFAVRAAMLA
jgi:drug/metabolite transporter (DMT)-like permease